MPTDRSPGDPQESDATPSHTPAQPVDRRTVLTVGAVSLAGLLALGAAANPRPSRLGAPRGDQALADALAPHLGGHRRVAAALLDGDEVRFAGFGADESTEFEVGSVSKTFTGALLAEAVARGEVTTQTTVVEILGAEAERSDIAFTTLAELATHTSGLPRLATAALPGAMISPFLRKDPYAGRDADQVIADALGSSLSGRGEFEYSNLAVAFEGQLLARAAGTDYATLLTERILDPLGLSATYAPIHAENLRDSASRGRGKNGLPQACWAASGTAPAGGIRSTARDMATYLARTLDGTAPGAAAATEVLHEVDETDTVGMNWLHNTFGGETMHTFHNGMTGGYAAFAGFTPETGRGIVLLTDTARDLDGLGIGVLTGEVAL